MKLLAALMLFSVTGSARVPVLLELFTSEGCSSCPPADALLQKLDREQPVDGADLIVLSEHVDYWNQLGWSDPFSSSVFSMRQRDYADHLGGEVYTPELVVDGDKGFVGSDQREAQHAIRDAIRQTKTPIQVTAERMQNKAKVTIHVEGSGDGVLYLALAHDTMRSQVLRGENAGRGLSHVAVVYSIEKIGKVSAGAAYDKELTVTVKGDSTRVVAFIEKSGVGRVTGIGQARL
jgi:hypothetical protein